MKDAILELGAIVSIFAGMLCIVWGTGAFLAWCAFIMRWKGGKAKQMKRSVELGWNTGLPPQDEWFFVREYADSAKSKYMGGCPQNYRWSLMRRIGDRCVSISGGFETPASNVSGWMYVRQESIKESVTKSLADEEAELAAMRAEERKGDEP